MKKERNELEFGYKSKNEAAITDRVHTSNNLENRLSWVEFSRENIIKKRLQLLKLLENKVKERDLRAIELYNKILSEIRDDLRSEGEEDWLSVVESMVGDSDE